MDRFFSGRFAGELSGKVPVEPSAGALSCHRQGSNTAAFSTISAIALNRPNLRLLSAEPVSGKFSLTSRKLPGIERLKTHINGDHHYFQNVPRGPHSSWGQPGLRLSTLQLKRVCRWADC
jgi:hypothetical protein